ncbi:MAG TPA: nuclear transport factor 2 family protein [Dongiaceae bacterium]
MPDTAIADTIRKCFTAYATQDRDLIESLIAEKFSFSSPRDDRIDRAEYFRRCWPNSDKFRSITVEKIVGEGDEAFVQYVGETVDGKRFRKVERHRVKDGRLVEVDVYFGRTL